MQIRQTARCSVPNAISAAVFIPSYAVLATLLGWWDYKRSTMKTEVVVGIHANPYFSDLAKALQLIAQGRGEQAAEI